MKDLGKPKYRSLPQLEHLHSYIMVYYVVYIQNILEKFIVDKSYPSITLMVVYSLDIKKDLFRPRDDGKKDIGTQRSIMPLDPPNTIGWYSRISFEISKASNILSWFFSLTEMWTPISLGTSIRSPPCQIVDKLSVPPRCSSPLMRSLRNRPHGYIHLLLSQR